MNLELKGLTALVTGASRGIGLAVAQGLAREGCHLHLAARTQTDLDAARARIAAECPVNITCHALDLGVSANMNELARRCKDIDILVNNAGGIPSGRLTDINETRWREAWELKVFGYINLTREIYRAMCARKRGVIINVIGVAGERLHQDYIAGSTGNAALMAFSQAVGSISVDDNVRVVCVNPGLIATDRTQVLRDASNPVDAAAYREVLEKLPYGRMGEPDEVADLVAFLCSARATYVSGAVFSIDAGMRYRH